MVRSLIGASILVLSVSVSATIEAKATTLDRSEFHVYEQKIHDARERNSRFRYDEVRRQLPLWTREAEATLGGNPEAMLAEYKKIIGASKGRHIYLLNRWLSKSTYIAKHNDIVLDWNFKEMFSADVNADEVKSKLMKHSDSVNHLRNHINENTIIIE